MVRESDVLRSALRADDDCPTLDEIAGEQISESIYAHLEHCARCRHELALYRDFAHGASEKYEWREVRWISSRLTDPSRPRRSATNWLRGVFSTGPTMAIAGALATAVLITNVTLEHDRAAVGPIQYTADSSERSGTVAQLSPRGELESAPALFEWTPYVGARSYRVTLMEVDHDVLWSATVQQTKCAIPQGVRRQIVPGKRLIWRVEALNDRSVVLASGEDDFHRRVVERRT